MTLIIALHDKRKYLLGRAAQLKLGFLVGVGHGGSGMCDWQSWQHLATCTWPAWQRVRKISLLPGRSCLLPLQRGAAMAAEAGKRQPSAQMTQFLVQEQAKAQLQQTVARLTDECFDKCVGNPGQSLAVLSR